MKIRYFTFLFFCCLLVKAQNDTEILLGSESSTNMSFHLYEPPLKIIAAFKDTIQAVNLFPEQLMQSIISAKSQEWVNYNTLGGASNSDKKSQQHFSRVVNMDIEKNYFELLHKLEFLVNGIPTAIIKFYINVIYSKEPISAAVVMQKHKNRWYRTSTTYTSRLSLMNMRFKSERLKKVLLGPRDEDNIINLFENINEAEGINLDKLVNEFYGWYSPVENTNMLNYFIDEKAW